MFKTFYTENYQILRITKNDLNKEKEDHIHEL